ncbi:MAG: tetratricopeptide repeat protein [Nitrospirae bacterium]|nr:tetratricopeptide repeat protein [Nitrospirota bacterium]
MARSYELTSDHKVELSRVGRLLEIGGGFQLVIAEFNDPLFRKKIIDEISAFGVKAVILEVSREKFPDFNDFEEKIAQLSKEYNVIHVIDLDTWLKMDEGDRMVLGFNYHREGIARICKASLFLWMTELGIYSFMTTVPDMWSWRSAVLSFLIEKEKTPSNLLTENGYDYMRAMPLERRLARINEIEDYLKVPPPDLAGKLLSMLYRELGSLYIHIGTKEGLNKGMDYYERALKIDIDLYGEEHQAVAEDYNNIGLAWSTFGESKKAIEYFEKALEIDLNIYGENHPSVIGTYNNIGAMWNYLGESKKALEYFEKVLNVSFNVYGENGPIVVSTYNNIGFAWNKLGQSKKALEYFEKALTIALNVYGDNHPDIAIGYNNIGTAWYSLGESKKALEYFEKALKIDLSVYGANHPNVASRYNNIGLTWYNIGELRKALEYYEKALEIALNVYGENHPNIANTYKNIGFAWNKLGQSKKALSYLEQALEISRRFYGEDHPHVRSIQDSIASLHKLKSA